MFNIYTLFNVLFLSFIENQTQASESRLPSYLFFFLSRFYPIGSLYVWPGCTMHAYEQYSFIGAYDTVSGPYQETHLIAGPSYSTESLCAAYG